MFTENIFTNRYRHAEEFRRLGAAVSIEGRVAYVTGVDRLTGAPLTSSDLRGGAAMIVAGLSAEGETEILDNGYINRVPVGAWGRCALRGAAVKGITCL